VTASGGSIAFLQFVQAKDDTIRWRFSQENAARKRYCTDYGIFDFAASGNLDAKVAFPLRKSHLEQPHNADM